MRARRYRFLFDGVGGVKGAVGAVGRRALAFALGAAAGATGVMRPSCLNAGAPWLRSSHHARALPRQLADQLRGARRMHPSRDRVRRHGRICRQFMNEHPRLRSSSCNAALRSRRMRSRRKLCSQANVRSITQRTRPSPEPLDGVNLTCASRCAERTCSLSPSNRWGPSGRPCLAALTGCGYCGEGGSGVESEDRWRRLSLSRTTMAGGSPPLA
jgi:hypothetical protein